MDEFQGFEHLEKRVKWLDSERRSDKTTIATLQNQFTKLESENSSLKQRVNEMDSEVTRLTTLLARLDKFDTLIDRLHTELTQQLTDFEEELQKKQVKTDKTRRLEIESMNKSLIEMHRVTDSVVIMQNDFKDQKEENLRISRVIEELKQQISDVNRFDEDYKRSLHLVEDNRRQDTKRLSDLQGEVVAQRKRLDENRGRLELSDDNLRQIENRINELQATEAKRREVQSAFFEKIKLQGIERDRVFKEWRDRFDAMEKINHGLESQLTGLESTHKAVKKSQAELDDVTQRFDRRINEITEMQRLNDERFRQEWTTFKADDLKRWTNYTLGQEEQHRETNRQVENMVKRVTDLEDLTRTIQNALGKINQDSVKRFQILLRSYQESIQMYSDISKSKL